MWKSCTRWKSSLWAPPRHLPKHWRLGLTNGPFQDGRPVPLLATSPRNGPGARPPRHHLPNAPGLLVRGLGRGR